MKHFKEFFTCPFCGKAIVAKEEFAQYLAGHGNYCGGCGKYLASALEESLADLVAEREASSSN